MSGVICSLHIADAEPLTGAGTALALRNVVA